MNLFSDNKKMEVHPIEFSVASAFVKAFHRHCKPTVGHIFSIGCFIGGRLVGVAVCGRPVARKLDDGATIEINRLATDGTRNACSKLYAASRNYARAKGFKKIITYTLMSENGASLRASNFILEAENVGGKSWSSVRSFVCPSGQLKKRWSYILS